MLWAEQYRRRLLGAMSRDVGYIECVYNVTSTTSTTRLLGSSFKIIQLKSMEIDGLSYEPSATHTFSTTGEHTVCFYPKGTFSNAENIFNSCSNLVSITFSLSPFVEVLLYYSFYNCTALTTLNWGESSFYAVNMSYMFYNCSSLLIADISKIMLNKTPSVAFNYAFRDCKFKELVIGETNVMTNQYALWSYDRQSDNIIDFSKVKKIKTWDQVTTNAYQPHIFNFGYCDLSEASFEENAFFDYYASLSTGKTILLGRPMNYNGWVSKQSSLRGTVEYNLEYDYSDLFYMFHYCTPVVHKAVNKTIRVRFCKDNAWVIRNVIERVSSSGFISPKYSYPNTGDYVVSLTPMDGCSLGFGSDGTEGIMGSSSIYRGFLKRVEFASNVSAIGDYAFAGVAATFDFSNHTTIPSCATTSFSASSNLRIVVPQSLYSVWRTTEGWSAFSNYIVSETEITANDGSTKLYLSVTNSSYKNVTLNLLQDIAGGVTIDWGDPSAQRFIVNGVEGIYASNGIHEFDITANTMYYPASLGGTEVGTITVKDEVQNICYGQTNEVYRVIDFSSADSYDPNIITSNDGWSFIQSSNDYKGLANNVISNGESSSVVLDTGMIGEVIVTFAQSSQTHYHYCNIYDSADKLLHSLEGRRYQSYEIRGKLSTTDGILRFAYRKNAGTTSTSGNDKCYIKKIEHYSWPELPE